MARNTSGIERQVLWFKDSEMNQVEAGRESHTWNVAIVNTPDEIGPIEHKLYEELTPISEVREIDSQDITDTNLFYKLFSIISPYNHDIDFSKVYCGKVKRDRRLYSRKTKNGWSDFINKLHQGTF